jgi:hypothetical protein
MDHLHLLGGHPAHIHGGQVSLGDMPSAAWTVEAAAAEARTGGRARGCWVELLELQRFFGFGEWRQWGGSGHGRRRLEQMGLVLRVLRRLVGAGDSHYWKKKSEFELSELSDVRGCVGGVGGGGVVGAAYEMA